MVSEHFNEAKSISVASIGSYLRVWTRVLQLLSTLPFSIHFLLFSLSVLFLQLELLFSMLFQPFFPLCNSFFNLFCGLLSTLGEFDIGLKLSNLLCNLNSGIFDQKFLPLKLLCLAMKLDGFSFDLFGVSDLFSLSLPLLLSFDDHSFFTLHGCGPLSSLSFCCTLPEFNSHFFSLKNLFLDFFVNSFFLWLEIL